ncbi:MAG: hypothetical protein ABIW76_12600 [Fibrobacteria bacterium]
MKIFATLLVSAGLASVTADVVRNPLNIGMAMEYGQIYESGNLVTPQYPIEKTTAKRTIGWLVQSATIDERMDVVVGIGGMFLYLYPDEGYAYQHSAISAVALAMAFGTYKWGDLQSPSTVLNFGFLPYTYNPDSKNIGSYLFRSTPYPTTITNSSWDLVNSAAHGSSKSKLWGSVVSFNFLDGKWKNDLILSVTDAYPLYDLSPAFVSTLQVGPMLQLGAGVHFYHLIQDDPKVNTRKIQYNAYFNFNGKDYYAGSSYYGTAAGVYMDRAKADSALAISDPGNSASHLASADANIARAAPLTAAEALVDSLVPANPAPPLVPLKYYTVNGTLLAARFSLDFKPLLGEKVDFKIYGEAAMLGIKNYPVFYEKPIERVPMMLGINIPTFGLLDMFSVEAEYWKNHYINSYFEVIAQGGKGAVPNYDHMALQGRLEVDPTLEYTKDDLSWAITAQKSIGKNLTIVGKAARDHLTLLNAGQGFGTDLQHDILVDDKGWYWVLHFQVAI